MSIFSNKLTLIVQHIKCNSFIYITLEITELTEHIFKQPERQFPTKGKCHAYVQTE